MDTQKLFIHTLRDLEQRATSSDEYAVLMSAALLRKLLMDGGRLMDQVNRTYRIKVTGTHVLSEGNHGDTLPHSPRVPPRFPLHPHPYLLRAHPWGCGTGSHHPSRNIRRPASTGGHHSRGTFAGTDRNSGVRGAARAGPVAVASWNGDGRYRPPPQSMNGPYPPTPTTRLSFWYGQSESG
jgi:hypothetical protein